MHLPRPRSLNGLIFAGLGLIAVPLLLAVLWALFNLDRLAEQSERLVSTGVEAADNNRLLSEYMDSLERSARQYAILRTDDSLALLKQDLDTIEERLDRMRPLTELADATILLDTIRDRARAIVVDLADPALGAEQVQQAITGFTPLRDDVSRLTRILSTHIDLEMSALKERARSAQQISAWQVAALLPGTLILVVFFTLLVARPIRQIDKAIDQLGNSGFSKPIAIKGPTDLERLGRQLEWLRLRLLELAREKNRFLRHMSHELKTPLANIREGTELLLDGTLGQQDAQQREVTDILRTNGLRLQKLIENLLSFSAWQTRSEILTISDFPLQALVQSVARQQRLALKAANIELELAVEDAVVSADRDKIRTVIDNLLSNAIKFTPPGGVITIRAQHTSGSFVLEFADTGPGILADEKPRIFEAFFQGRRHQGGQVAGTGIGLSVVLECVQAHDGTIELVDSDEFPGAHIRVQVPQERRAARGRLAASA